MVRGILHFTAWEYLMSKFVVKAEFVHVDPRRHCLTSLLPPDERLPLYNGSTSLFYKYVCLIPSRVTRAPAVVGDLLPFTPWPCHPATVCQGGEGAERITAPLTQLWKRCHQISKMFEDLLNHWCNIILPSPPPPSPASCQPHSLYR